MRKLQKDARQFPDKKPRVQRDEIRAPRPAPFEPIPLQIPVHVPQRPAERREESISEPRGVVVIDYGSE